MLYRALLTAVSSFLLLLSLPAAAEPDIPRLPDGKPDLNGVWQVFSRANDGLEAHPAQAARAMQPGPFGPVPAEEVVHLGAVAAVPASLGVVVGDKIPYTEAGKAKQQENQNTDQ